MTRKLSGLWSMFIANRAPLASLAVVGTLACIVAVTGCNSSSAPPGPTPDGGADGTVTACVTPTFSLPAGTVPAGTAVTLTATGLPTNGFIYYTTDSTMPTHASTFVISGGTITVSQTETVTAIAYASGACSDSAAATVTYTVAVADAGPDVVTTACATPTFAPPAGVIDVGTTVAIVPPADFPTTFPQGNATIFYTVDGTLPTHLSSAYSGPIQVNSSETIRAIAYYPGTCTDSAIALASYTVVLPDGTSLAPPAFNPPSATQPNDFLVQLTDNDPAATICFTFGTGIPTCTVTATAATCSGTSQTYNAGAGLGTTGSVTINGAVTSNTTGTVTVNAIACAVGGTTTTSVAQAYTLKGAAPTMQGPAPSATLPFVTAGYAPTLASSTTASTVRYTTDGSTPTCNTGNLLGGNPFAVTAFTGNSTFNAITCKNGYAPSAVGGPFVYDIVLPTPTFVDATTPAVAEGTGTYDGAPTIAFSDGIAAALPGLYYCSTTDSSAPTCGATAGACGHGTAGATLAITATGTVVNVVACAPSNTASAAGTATYTLQLDPPALDLPGCTETNNAGTSCRANGPTTAVTSYDIPATAAGAFQPFIEETLGTLPPSVATQPTYQFVCVQEGGTPSCSATGCSAGATLITPVAANGFKTALTVPLAAAGAVVAGNTWSIIGCPGSTSAGFLPSAVTTVGFALPGAAPSPVLVAGTGSGTYTSPIAPAFINSGTTAETLCYGTYPTATPPTTPVSCTAGGACAATVGYTASATVALPAATPGATTTVASIAVTSGGVGYTSAPTVVVGNPPVSGGALTAQATANVSYSIALPAMPATGGVGCSAANPIVTFSTGTATATATINAANVVTGLTVTNAGSGYTTAPTPVWTNLNCTTAPTVTPTLVNGVVTSVTVTNAGVGYTTIPSVTFVGGGATTAATATATLTAAPVTTPLPVQQASGVSIDVVGCISGSPTSPLQTYTYNFAESTPTVTDATVAVVGASTVALGDTLVLTTSSTFTATPDICYTTDGTAPNAACATAGTTICHASPLSIATTSTTFTTNTLKAIACNPASQTVQTNSPAYSAALNLVVATPVPPPAKVGGTYYNLESPTLSTTTPGATICYTTVGATPTCAAGVCTAGSTTYTGAIPVTATGTVLKAIACVGAYTSGVSTNTYTYQVTPIILSNVPVLPLGYTAPATCPAAIDVGLDCSEGTTGGVKGCSTATFNAGGTTAGATVCYSTTVAVTSCAAATGVTCTGAPYHAVVSPTQDLDLTINALACAPGFNNSSATFTITATPYSNAVTFTGVPVADFAVAPINENQVANSAGNGNAYFSLTGTTLYFGLDTVTPSATTYTTIYIGNGSTAGAATATTSATGSKPLNPAEGIQYAIQFPTAGTTATLLEWASGTASWVAAAGVPTVNATGTAEEFSIALSALPQLVVTPATNITTALGAVVDGAGTAGAAALFSFPGAGTDYATHWFAYPTASCLYPNAAGAIH